MLKFNGILGKTEKYWEGKNKDKKKKIENEIKETEKTMSLTNKNVSNINTTSYNSQSFINEDSSFNSNEEIKLNNFIMMLENKLGKFFKFI